MSDVGNKRNQTYLLVYDQSDRVINVVLLHDEKVNTIGGINAKICLQNTIPDILADIRKQDGKYVFSCKTDCGASINDTKVNINGELKTGDIIQIRQTKMQFCSSEAQPIEKDSNSLLFDCKVNAQQNVLKDRFTLLESLSTTGLGQVMIIEDIILKRPLVLKTLPNEFSFDERMLKRFIIEAAILANLEHSNIVPIYEFGYIGESLPYYTMQYINGKPLYKATQEKILEDKLKALHGAASAVEYAHSQGVWHGDIKPANILVTDTNITYVIDWGLATICTDRDFKLSKTLKQLLLEEEPLETNKIFGTPEYLSPERANRQKHLTGAVSDIWSFGIILFEILTGKHPLKILNGQHSLNSDQILSRIINSPFPEEEDFAENIPDELKTLCIKMLIKDPTERVQSLKEFIDILAKYIKNHTNTNTYLSYSSKKQEIHVQYTTPASTILNQNKLPRIKSERSDKTPEIFLEKKKQLLIKAATLSVFNLWKEKKKLVAGIYDL